jgi:hypothetical protein
MAGVGPPLDEDALMSAALTSTDIGPPPPPPQEAEGLKRAREAEDERYDPKRRKVTTEEEAKLRTELKEAIQEREAKHAQFADFLKTRVANIDFALMSREQRARLRTDWMTTYAFATMPEMDAYIARERQTRLDREVAEFTDEVKRMPLGTPGRYRRDTVHDFARPNGQQEYLRRHHYMYLTPTMVDLLPVYQQRLAEWRNLVQGMMAEDEREKETERKRLVEEIKTWPVDFNEYLDDYLEAHGYRYLQMDDVPLMPEWTEWFRRQKRWQLAENLKTPAFYDLVITWPPTEGYMQLLRDEVEDELTDDEIREIWLRERNRRGLTSSVALHENELYSPPVPAAASPPPVPVPGSTTFGLGGRFRRHRHKSARSDCCI